MSDQLNFKQVPFDTMYYNNLSKQGGQVLIECDPNRTVLKIIESCITKNNTVLSDAELAQWILRYHIQRTKNHVENVKLCANYLREFFQFGGYFDRFIAKVQQHDYDKLQGNEHVASFALNAPLYKYKDLYEISAESKRVYEEIEWVKHHTLNDHHPENYMRRPDPEKEQWVITDDELEEAYKDKGGHPAILMALGEMVADWAAVGIEMGDTSKDWWLKNKDKRWSYGPRYTQALEACLEWIPSKLYVQSSEPIPDPPKLKMNVMSEVSEEVISQIVADNIKDGLVYHASPVKVDVLSGKHTGKWSGEQGNVFVTPVKGLAACFIINKNDVADKAEQQLGGRLIGLNFGYDVWNKPVDKLRTLPREIVVTLNVRGLKPFTGESTGYLYTIDYTKYADKTHMFHKNPNSDVEFLIEGDVRYKSCEKITIKWKCVSSEDNIKRHGEAKVDSETSLEEYDEQKLRDSVYSEAISADTKDEDRGPISESDKKKIGKYIYHGTHRDLDIKNLGIHVCKNRANTDIKAPVVYMNRTLGVASLHVVPFMIGHGSKLKNYEEHFVNLEEAIRSESPVKHVEIVHNDPDLEECSGEQTGYIYWVEVKEFLDDLYYATPAKPNDWNFVSYRQLPIAKKTEVKVAWHKKYDPDFAKKVKGGFMAVEGLSAEAQQSSTPSKIAQKKKKILDFICKLCDTMEPSGLNSKRYRQIIGNMNDKEFDQFMNYMKEGKWQLHLVAPNMIVNLQNEDLLKACDMIGLDLFQRVWMYDKATGRKYLTDNKYMFVKLPIRRQQQFLDEKISVPDNDRTIDGLTGQVTGDSRACSITNPEIQILAARGLDKTMQELVNIRGGNIHGYSEFRRMLEENGEADLDMIDPNSRTRASVVGGKLLQSMMLDTNL